MAQHQAREKGMQIVYVTDEEKETIAKSLMSLLKMKIWRMFCKHLAASMEAGASG